MQNSIKSTLPSLTFLLLGMLFFFLLSVVSLPIIVSKFVFAVIAIVSLYYMSKAFLRFENISLTVVNLLPNRGTLIRLGFGLMIGTIIVGAMLIALFTLTDLGIERIKTQAMLPFLFASLVIVPLALMEELLFRGYAFFRLSQILNIRWVLLITAVLFALYHYNGSQNIGTLLLGPGIWGVAFGVAAYLSNSIAVPLGIHISANFLQALFGLKPHFISLWSVIDNTSSTITSINPENLGLIMQLLVLIISIVALESALKIKK